MKRIEYPERGSNEFKKLIAEYKAIFAADLPILEQRWLQWKQQNAHVVALFPQTVEELLIADVGVLAGVYACFESLGFPLRLGHHRNPVLLTLDGIFDYTNKYSDAIADFFIDHAEQLHISSCYYCETAYINAYQARKRQFDVDHFLPKEKCPILSLSLFNFVPSCQVCNSRIKLAKVIGDNIVDYEKFNPAGKDYAFDKKVKIRLRMKPGFKHNLNNPKAYYIYFCCKGDYWKVVNYFHLEERYEFHKLEALRIKRLKAQYPPSARRKIAKLLGFSETKVYEDLFHEHFLQNNNRCFAKLTSDML